MGSETMKPAGEACLSCPARDAKCVWPEKARTDGRIRLAVVGEAPSRDDLASGRPFYGSPGRLMLKELRPLGVGRADVHWTNAVLCECPQEQQKDAAKACKERLRAELEAVDPVVVIPVGAWGLGSTLALKKKPQILKWRGSVSVRDFSKKEWDPEGTEGSLVTPTLHPTYILRGGEKWLKTFRRDLARAVKLVTEGWTSPEKAGGHRLVVPRMEGPTGWAQLEHQLRCLGPEVSFDVETVGLGPTETELVCFGISDGRLTIVVPWSVDRAGSSPYWRYPEKIAEKVSTCLRTKSVWTHNGFAFDHIVAARYGIDLGPNLHDTLNLYHVLESHLPKNLAHVCTQWLDVPPWKNLEDRTADLERLYTYNGRDCLFTILAAFAMKDELRVAV